MNVVLFTLDCVRQDRLGCYGHAGGLTPHIDGVADQGVKFTQAITAATFTDPSHASLLTSTWPTVHGVYWNAVRLEKDGPETLAKVLLESGYETVAAVSVEHLSSFFGLNRGFKTYYNSSPLDVLFHYSSQYKIGKWKLSHFLDWSRARLKLFRTHWRTGEKTNRDVQKWLMRNRGKRFFMWIHYFDAHSYHGKSDPHRDPRPAYEAKVKYVDERVGEVQSWIKEYFADDTLFVIVSDHGESFAEEAYKGGSGHGRSLSDREVVVPLVIGPLPKFAGVAVTAQARTIDIAPTILDILGLPIPDQWQGVSLWPYIRGEQGQKLYAYCIADPKHENPRCIRTEDWKLIRSETTTRLYDLQTDPMETTDVSAREPEILAELSRLLSEWEEGKRTDYTVEEEKVIMDMLRDLGYLE